LRCRPIRGHCHNADGRIDAALGGQAVQLGDQVLAGDAALDHPAQAFTGVLVDDGNDLDRPTIGGDVEPEVHRPHPVGRIRDHCQWRGRGAVPLAPSTLRHPKPFLTPKALHLLCD